MSKINKVAIVGGLRTPFVKAGTHFRDIRMKEMGAKLLTAIVDKYSLTENNLDEFIFSTVLLDPRLPNLAREIQLEAGLSKNIYAHTVSNNCISGLVAIANASERIASSKSRSAIAGGVEDMSNPTLPHRYEVAKLFTDFFRAKSTTDKLKLLAQLRITKLLPQAPSIKEPSTGLSMGQHTEITAKEFKIKREEQDQIAFYSHQNANKAWEEGLYKDEVMELMGVSKDKLIRPDTTLEKLAGLRSVFDRSEQGTLTAGNSSPLTDGASAVLLMSEEFAKSQGHEVLATISDYEFSAIDPDRGLLMAPGVCVPRLLKRNNMMLDDFDFIEIHEAFAAQVLANIKAWEEGWDGESLGTVNPDKLNVNGGSIALGHPFAATGGRIILTLANQLKRSGKKYGLVSICAAGAEAGAFILERN